MVDSTTPKLSIKLQGDLQRNPDVTIGAYKPEPVAALPVPKPDDADLGTPVNPNVSTPVLDIQPDSTVTKMQSFGAGFAPVGRDLYQAISEKMHFEPVEGYDPQADYDEFVQTYSITNPEEIKSLLTATSKGAFDNRALRIQEKRDRDVKINANPWSAVVGSAFDIDIPVAIASGGVGSAVKAGVAAKRVVSAGTAGATIGTAMGVAGDAQMTSDAERIGVVAAGVLGGATALVRPRKPSTTPLTPTSPNSTVSTSAILPEEAVVSHSIPKPVLPEGTVISPLPTSTTTKTTPPNLSGLQYEPAPEGTNVQPSTMPPTQLQKVNDVTAGVSGALPRTALDDILGGVDLEAAANYVAGSKSTQVRNTTLRTSGSGLDSRIHLEQGFGLSEDTEELITRALAKVQRLRESFRKRHPELYTEQANRERQVYGIAGGKARTVADVISRKGEYEVSTNRMEQLVYDNPMFTTEVRDGTMYITGVVHPDVGTWVGKDPDGVIHNLLDSLEAATTNTSTTAIPTRPPAGSGVKTQYQVPTTSTTATAPISGSGVFKQTQLSQAQLLDDLVEAEIQSISAPTPSTVVSIPVGSSRINLSSPLQGDGTELKLPKLSVEHHAVAALQSAADEMFYYTKGDPEEAMNRILASPYTQGDDVVTHANAVLRGMEIKLVPFEQSIEIATKELHGTTSLFGTLFRKDHNKRLQQTSMDVYSELQKIDQVVVEAAGTGKTLSNAEIHALIDATSNPDAIKASMKTYVDSNIAGEMYDHIKRVGLMDEDALEHIVRRPTYVTTKHSYEAQKRFIDADTVSTSGRRLAVANFLGEQITKMYPDLMRGIKGTDGKVINLKPDAIGAKFMDNMKVRSENPNAVRTIGVSKDELYDMLTSQGLDDSAAKALSVKLTQTRSAQQGEKHLRRRIDWDWTKTATAPDGTVFGMRDLVDQNAYHTIVDYNRRMSKRVGLAQYGFKDAQSLQDAKSRIMDNLPAGTNHNKARQYLDNVINGALGNPIGADMPDWVRSMNTIGGSILLSGSGLYNAIELGVQVQRIGLLRSIPHLVPALKPMVKTVGSYSKLEAKSLHDALVGKLMSTDRWQNIMTHYADDFTIEGGFHESVQYFGQSTRFLNGSEYIKRYQIGLFASVFVDAFKGAAKGSPNSIKFLKEGLRFSDELLEKTTQQFNKHGDNIDGWDADIRIAMEQKVFHEGDNLAHVVHHGEVPSFMEYSQVGKIIFPFMRYLFAMQQKILRRVHIRDGTTGVALVLAVQAPLAVMVAHIKRAMNGDKPYDMDNPEDVKMFIRSTLNGVSGLGSMAYPIDIMMSGGQNMGSTIALAPIGKMVGLTEGIITGEATARDFKEATPFNTILPWNLYLAAINDED